MQQSKSSEEGKNIKIQNKQNSAVKLPGNSSISTLKRFVEAEIWNRIGFVSKLTHFDESVDPRSTKMKHLKHQAGMMSMPVVFPVVDSCISP
jgi:hypothetical protein